MVMKRRGKLARQRDTYDDDIDRLAERVWTRGRGQIRNRADFLSVFTTYMHGTNQANDRGLQDKVFGRIQEKHPKVSSTLKTTRKRVEVFKEAGVKPSPSEFDTSGVIKGRIVYARRTKYKRVYKGKVREFTVYRDKKGRFVSVK